jgi:transcription termination factor Rho
MTNSNSKFPESRGDRRKSLLRRRSESASGSGSQDTPADDERPQDRLGDADPSSYDDELDGPLSLAEELADEADRGVRDDTNDRYEKIKQGEIHIAELQKMSMGELIDEARKENVTDVAGMKKQDLIFRILKERVDVRRRNIGDPPGRVWLPAQPGLPLPVLSGRHLRVSQPDSPFWSADGMHRFGSNTPAEGERTLLRAVACGSDQLSGSEPDGGEGLV